MTSDNSLLPILRRLDEIERKLDRMLEELRTLNTPAASKSLAQMNPGTGAKRPRSIRLYAMQQSGKGRIVLRSALPTCPGLQWLGPFPPCGTAGHHWVRLIDVIDVVG